MHIAQSSAYMGRSHKNYTISFNDVWTLRGQESPLINKKGLMYLTELINHSDKLVNQQDVKGYACIKKQYMIRTLYVVSFLMEGWIPTHYIQSNCPPPPCHIRTYINCTPSFHQFMQYTDNFSNFLRRQACASASKFLYVMHLYYLRSYF